MANLQTCYRCEGRVLTGDKHSTLEECIRQLRHELDALRTLVRTLMLAALEREESEGAALAAHKKAREQSPPASGEEA
mgnify:CR=1 FL=1